MKFKDQLLVIVITSVISVIANAINKNVTAPEIDFGNLLLAAIQGVPGIVILALICVAGLGLARILPGSIPAVAYIVTIGTIVTIPGVPFSNIVSEYTSKVDFVTLCTPILAYAGIYTGSNLDGLKKTGPKIILLAVFVMIGTYIGSAVIAQLILKLMGQI